MFIGVGASLGPQAYQVGLRVWAAAAALALLLVARPPAIGDPGLPWGLALLTMHGGGRTYLTFRRSIRLITGR